MKTRVRRIAAKTRHHRQEILIVVVDRDPHRGRGHGRPLDDEGHDQTAVVTITVVIGDRVGHLDVELDLDRRLRGEDKSSSSSSSNEEIVIRVLLGDVARVILGGQVRPLVIAENHLLRKWSFLFLLFVSSLMEIRKRE